MPKYAVLLRGVNVGGRSMLPMADLRRVLESLGHTDVSTHLQSGNAVITSDDEDTERLAKQIGKALTEERGAETRALVRTGAELAAVIADNPFPEALAKPALLHVAFLSVQPDLEKVATLDPDVCAPDKFRVGDHAVYLHFAVGSGRSKMADTVLKHLFRGQRDVVVTSRNWNTVTALAAKTES
jgi:uncharacterized protein (DUF1697 family)